MKFVKFRIEPHWHVGWNQGEVIALGSADDVMRDIVCAGKREGVAIIATQTETEIITRANGKPFVRAELCTDSCMEEVRGGGKGRK